MSALVPTTTESVTRELAPLKHDPETLRATWQQVQQECAGQRVTARLVNKAVQEVLALQSPGDGDDDLNGQLGPDDRLKHATQSDKVELAVSYMLLVADTLSELTDVSMAEFASECIRSNDRLDEVYLATLIVWLTRLYEELSARGYFPDGGEPELARLDDGTPT